MAQAEAHRGPDVLVLRSVQEATEVTLMTEVEAGASGYSVTGGGHQGIFVKQVLKDSSAAKLFSLREGASNAPPWAPHGLPRTEGLRGKRAILVLRTALLRRPGHLQAGAAARAGRGGLLPPWGSLEGVWGSCSGACLTWPGGRVSWGRGETGDQPEALSVQGTSCSVPLCSSTILSMKTLSKSCSTQSPTGFSSTSDGNVPPQTTRTWPPGALSLA